jgi:hypothetical protein
MINLPTPQITPDHTPRTSPVQANLTLQFQSYIPPSVTEYPSVKEEGDYQNFRPVERFCSQVMDYGQQEMKETPMLSFPPPVRNERMMDRFPMNPPPMLQIHENMNAGMSMMSPTYTPHSNDAYSPNLLNSGQLSYMQHQMGQIPSPEEMQNQQNLLSEMNYQRTFNEEMYKPVNRRQLPPRINTQIPMYAQPLTGQYQSYSFKQQHQDDRRFSAPILSPMYSKENQLGFGMQYDQQQNQRQ